MRGRIAKAAALMVVALGFVVAPPAAAATPLELGTPVADDRVEVTPLAATQPSEYAGIPGRWYVVDVRMVGVAGLDATPLLDWHIMLPDGTSLVPFPTNAGTVPDGRLGAGDVVVLELGFLVVGDASGAARLVYEPFLDPEPLGVWTVTIESPREPVGGVTRPAVTVPTDLPVEGLGYEHVRAFAARYEIQSDATILVTESIEYDFGFLERHGIYRDLALFQPIDDDHERVYPISAVDVEAAAGTPAEFVISRDGDLQRIRIGDPDITIRGVHTYTLEYRLGGALNPQPGGPELYFNVTGVWEVPIEEVTIEVVAPDGVTQAACFAGPTGSTASCREAVVTGEGARFGHDGLFPGGQLTIVAALPARSVAEPAPILTDAPRDLIDAVEPDPINIGGAGLVLALGLTTVVGLAWFTGRDHVRSGSHVDARFATSDVAARRLPVIRRWETPVEFVPPEGVRPGLLGTLYDERADPVDVSATIVDLAVRGFLRIEEVPKEGWFGKADHRLVKLNHDDEALLPYERMLFRGLFAGGEVEILLSDLEDTFAPKLAQVRSSMYSETVRRKWFAKRPDKTRTKWVLIGTAITVAGGGAVALAIVTKYAVWPAVALCLVGLVFMVASRWMPRRTATGTAALRHAEGFRRFIVESERYRSEFDERANLFTEYLPYSIAFGCVDKWAKAFADLQTGELPSTDSFYRGTDRFDAGSFSKSVNGFASSAGATMASTPGGSGSSGFSGGSSGGGGGGGGGGSW